MSSSPLAPADGEKLLHVASVGRLGRQALQRPANRVRVKFAPRRQVGDGVTRPPAGAERIHLPARVRKTSPIRREGARFLISPKRLERDILPGSRGRTSVSRNRDLSLKEKSPSHEWGEDSSIAKPGAAGKGRKLAMRGRVLLGYAPRVREALPQKSRDGCEPPYFQETENLVPIDGGRRRRGQPVRTPRTRDGGRARGRTRGAGSPRNSLPSLVGASSSPSRGSIPVGGDAEEDALVSVEEADWGDGAAALQAACTFPSPGWMRTLLPLRRERPKRGGPAALGLHRAGFR